MLPLFATRVCVCIVGVVLGRGCVVLTDATIVCHSCVCIVGVVLGQGCVILTDATIVCHSCVCVLWVWHLGRDAYY